MFSSGSDIQHRFGEFTYRASSAITGCATGDSRLNKAQVGCSDGGTYLFRVSKQGKYRPGNVEFSNDCPSRMRIFLVRKPSAAPKPSVTIVPENAASISCVT